MNEFQLKYGTNPNQKPARIYMADGCDLPVQILNGRPGYINFLDAFNSWQLVRDLKEALGHARRRQLQACLPRRCGHRPAPGRHAARACTTSPPRPSCLPWPAPTPAPAAPTACPALATGSRCPMSATCSTAKLIQHEVSDGIIAPGYDA